MAKRSTIPLVLASIILLTISQKIAAQPAATKFRIKDSGTMEGGELYITVGGREKNL